MDVEWKSRTRMDEINKKQTELVVQGISSEKKRLMYKTWKKAIGKNAFKEQHNAFKSMNFCDMETSNVVERMV